MTIGTNIKNLREKYGLSQKELAQIAEVTDKAVSTWETGKKAPRMGAIEKIAHHFHIRKSDIIEDASPTFPIRTAAMVPIIGSVRCGPGGPAYEYIDEYVSIDDSYRNPDEIRGFRATGDSMEGDEIHDGDLCLVHLQDEVEDGALAVVVIDGEEGTLKRIRRQPGMIILEASNPAYQTRVFAGEAANTIRIIGKVVEVRHKK